MSLVDKSCQSVEWYTPPEILDAVREVLGSPIPLDPCTTPENPTGALDFYTPREDGLQQVWTRPAFVNPPYGKALYGWLQKVAEVPEGGIPVVLLVSASSRWDQIKWQRLYSPALTCFCMPVGRVKFLTPDGTRSKGSPPYPSLLYFYNLSPEKVAAAFAHLGTTVRQDVCGLPAYDPPRATPKLGPG